MFSKLFKPKEEKLKEQRLTDDMEPMPYFVPQCSRCLKRTYDKKQGTGCELYGKEPEKYITNKEECPSKEERGNG